MAAKKIYPKIQKVNCINCGHESERLCENYRQSRLLYICCEECEEERKIKLIKREVKPYHYKGKGYDKEKFTDDGNPLYPRNTVYTITQLTEFEKKLL